MKIEGTFEVKWRDPETGEILSDVMTLTGDRHVSPKEWACDLAYARADKGWYSVKEVK